MDWDENLSRLKKELVDLFPLYNDIVPVVREVNLSLGKYNFNDSGENIWSGVLTSPSTQGKLLTIVRYAKNKYPDNKTLGELEEWLARVGEESVLLPLRRSLSELSVFLCHVTEEHPHNTYWSMSLELKKHQENGLKTWFDEELKVNSDQWEEFVHTVVPTCQVVLLCITPNTVKEGVLDQRIKFVLDLLTQRPSIRVITVLLGKYSIPPELEPFPILHYKERLGSERLLQRLATIAQELGIDVAIPLSRHLDAAMNEEVQVEHEADLLVMVRLPDSEGLKKLLGENSLYRVLPKQVNSQEFALKFDLDERGNLSPLDLLVEIDSPGFNPPKQRQKIAIQPFKDSEVCHFLLTPTKTGDLTVIIRVLLTDENLSGSSFFRVKCFSELTALLKPTRTVITMSLGVFGIGKKHNKGSLPPLLLPILAGDTLTHNPTSTPLETRAVENGNNPNQETSFRESERNRLLRELDNPRTSHRRRLEIGDYLDKIGDTRPGVGVGKDNLPDILWVPVATGGRIKIKEEIFKVQPFYIAKYMITYAQYEAFVKAQDGYNNLEWWRGMPSRWKRQKLDEQHTKFRNSPRDNVSWYQSVAFAHWLNQRLKGISFPNPDNSVGTALIVGKNAQVRLPTEWEWQWAAQGGTEQREYPWGKWQEGNANTNEAKLERAVAVGLYPQGAAVCGALDMSGNLWEWCLNKYTKLKETQLDDNGDWRVLRGGAFYRNQVNASCAARSGGSPSLDYDDIGFRLVVASPIAPI